MPLKTCVSFAALMAFALPGTAMQGSAPVRTRQIENVLSWLPEATTSLIVTGLGLPFEDFSVSFDFAVYGFLLGKSGYEGCDGLPHALRGPRPSGRDLARRTIGGEVSRRRHRQRQADQGGEMPAALGVGPAADR